jgi:hypothetical protein
MTIMTIIIIIIIMVGVGIVTGYWLHGVAGA